MPSTLHQKIKLPQENRVVIISVETKVAIAALRLALKEIPISPNFEVYMIYEADMSEKVLGMMHSMELLLGMRLGRNQ